MGDDSAVYVWKKVNVNRSNRPVLLDGENIVYVRDNVGLYQGRVKIVNRQSGRIYLTNHRIIYVDNVDTEQSMGIELQSVVRGELIEKFFRSSPKVKVYIKANEESDNDDSADGDANKTGANTPAVDWVCKICSFNNHLPSQFDINQLPKCVSCGIPPGEKYIESLLEAANNVNTGSERDDQCPKCTFINHPSLKYCEMCGTELKSSLPETLRQRLATESSSVDSISRSTGAETDFSYLNIKLEDKETYSGPEKYIKVSFRTSGEVQFFESLTEVMDARKWEKLMKSGNINKDGTRINDQLTGKSNESETGKNDRIIKESGIYRLQLLSEQTRKQNEMTLSTSLEDLEQLMYKAQDLIKLSSSFNKLIKPITVNYANNKISPLTINKQSRFYHEELSRHVSEYLINYKLTKTSSMITLQDLFAAYNRYLILTQGFGTELVDSEDFNKSIDQFQKLNLPIILNEYETGLKVLKPKFNDDYSQVIIKFLKQQESDFKFNKFKQSYLNSLDEDDYFKTNFRYFRGNTVSDISEFFNWSNAITIEELNMLVEQGNVLIDKTIMGTFYFINKFGNYDFHQESVQDEQLMQNFKKQVIAEQINLEKSYQNKSESEFDNPTYGSMTTGDSNVIIAEPSQVPSSNVSTTLDELQGLSFT